MIYLGFLLVCCIRNANALNSENSSLGEKITEKVAIPTNMVFTNTCIEDLGCFYNGPPFWDHLIRPICPPPVTKLNIRYLLFTPTNKEVEYDLQSSSESLKNSPYDSQQDTIFLIHGFIEKLTPNSTRFQMKDELLKYRSINVIIVDWTAHNSPEYEQAVSNTRVVGAHVARLITITGIRPETIHIVGHSLGAHIAGYCGERTPGLYRIIGLDPAGPYFDGMVNEVCLDPSDAAFVFVIHTNAASSLLEGYGTNKARGCLDFYPNGGGKQPGCIHLSPDGSKEVTKDLLNDVKHWMNCDHTRANDLFISSIAKCKCKFNAVVCSNYEDFKDEVCPPDNSITVKMGFHSSMIPGLNCSSKLYLETSKSSPFC